MKKILSVVLLLSLCLGLFAGCGTQGGADATTEAATNQYAATAEDIAKLEGFYTGLQVVYGDTHSHSASSEFSDGKKSFEEWKAHMEEKQIDFVTIVDHRQTIHMDRDDWDPTVFVGGSEPGLNVTGVEVFSKNNIDYSMIFTDVEGLKTHLQKYPIEYQYNPKTGRFVSGLKADHTKIAEIIQSIKDNGGMFVHVHPFLIDSYGGYYNPKNTMDYWFADQVGLEIFNQIAESYDPAYNTKAYECWVELINTGKQIWATRGSDCHSELPHIISLNAMYTAEKNDKAYFANLKVGNFTAGPVGIRTAVGDTLTGSKGSFEGQRVVLAVGDFHPQIVEDGHTYRVDVYDDQGLIFSQDISTTETNYFAFDADNAKKLYRADVVDATTGKMIATGNPVWNG